MLRKITKTLLIGTLFIGIVYASESFCSAWSLNPFASSDSQARTHNTSMTKKSPSVLDKIGSGTKNFFNKTGEALHLKKPQPRKAPPVVAPKPRTISQPYHEKKGLFSWLAPKEDRPTTVKGWISSTKQVTP
jgi:hypothetical protein